MQDYYAWKEWLKDIIAHAMLANPAFYEIPKYRKISNYCFVQISEER